METVELYLQDKLHQQKVEGLKLLMKELGYSDHVINDCTAENIKDYALSMLHGVAKKIVTVNIETLEISKNEKIERLCREMGKLLHSLDLIPARYDQFITNCINGSVDGIKKILESRTSNP